MVAPLVNQAASSCARHPLFSRAIGSGAVNVRPTHNSDSDESALNEAIRLAERAGVTRVADITGLDRLGIPVVSIVRPNSRSLSVFSGKGRTHVEACLSGLFECLELYHAELFDEAMPLTDLARDVIVPDLSLWPRAKSAPPLRRLDPDTIRVAVGEDLALGAAVAVPAGLVHGRFEPDWHLTGDGFLTSSNGLCAGATREMALLHGLCEVIERDAIAISRIQTASARPTIDWRTVQDEASLGFYELCRAEHIEVLLFDITGHLGVPVFYCRLIDTAENDLRIPVPTDGAACHPDPSIAIRQAIAEAIQTRALLISGARDDLEPPFYGAYLGDPDAQREVVAMRDGPEHGSGGTMDMLQWVLSRLSRTGFQGAVAVDLSRTDGPPFFFRVVVPGLEGSPLSSRYSPGDRVLSARG